MEHARLANRSVFCIVRVESIHAIVTTDEIVAIPGIAEQIDDGAELIREGEDILFLRQGADDVPGKFRKALSRR